MSGMCKGWGGVSGGEWWAAGGGLNFLLGLFGLAMSLQSASHRSGPKRRLTTTGVNFRPMPSVCM